MKDEIEMNLYHINCLKNKIVFKIVCHLFQSVNQLSLSKTKYDDEKQNVKNHKKNHSADKKNKLYCAFKFNNNTKRNCNAL